jgi:hypothetical protein
LAGEARCNSEDELEATGRTGGDFFFFNEVPQEP